MSKTNTLLAATGLAALATRLTAAPRKKAKTRGMIARWPGEAGSRTTGTRMPDKARIEAARHNKTLGGPTTVSAFMEKARQETKNRGSLWTFHKGKTAGPRPAETYRSARRDIAKVVRRRAFEAAAP